MTTAAYPVVADRDDDFASALKTATKGCWVVYVLRSVPEPRRTYCGVTNDFAHRLRQHNGELAGGAAATHSGRPWKPWALMTGFDAVDVSQGGSPRRLAMRAEWLCKVCHYRERGSAEERGSVKRRGPEFRLFLLRRALGLCLPRCSSLRLTVDGISVDDVPTEKTDGALSCAASSLLKTPKRRQE